MSEYMVQLRYTVRVTVTDDNAIDRVVNNDNDWSGSFYFSDVTDPTERRDKALGMLAANIGIGRSRLSSLDGWADMPDDAVRASAYDMEVEHVQVVTSRGDGSNTRGST